MLAGREEAVVDVAVLRMEVAKIEIASVEEMIVWDTAVGLPAGRGAVEGDAVADAVGLRRASEDLDSLLAAAAATSVGLVSMARLLAVLVAIGWDRVGLAAAWHGRSVFGVTRPDQARHMRALAPAHVAVVDEAGAEARHLHSPLAACSALLIPLEAAAVVTRVQGCCRSPARWAPEVWSLVERARAAVEAVVVAVRLAVEVSAPSLLALPSISAVARGRTPLAVSVGTRKLSIAAPGQRMLLLGLCVSEARSIAKHIRLLASLPDMDGTLFPRYSYTGWNELPSLLSA